jgi:hypothetical protein
LAISETIGIDPFAGPRTTARGYVWVVRLIGSFGLPTCPVSRVLRPPSTQNPPCVDSESGIYVVIDYYTGAFIGFGS